MSINNILNKINQIEKELRYEYHEIDDIISIEFYTDNNGAIHSSYYEYFSFEKLSDIREFIKLSYQYIIENRKKYPI